MPIKVNAHPEGRTSSGEHSTIHHPPPDDEPSQEKKKIPDTGWRGTPEVPSAEGGEGEENFQEKPPYRWEGEGDLFKVKYRSECWCGDVAFEFHGDPVDAKHCHCKQCQRLHGAPFQWAVIFPKTSVRMVKNNRDSLHFFSTQTRDAKHHVPCKVSCNSCRAPIFDEGRTTVLAYPSSFIFEDGKIPLLFQPTCHIFYGERVLEVPDGVPKYEGHKGQSKLMQELSDDVGLMPKYKGSTEDTRNGNGTGSEKDSKMHDGAGVEDDSADSEELPQDDSIAHRVKRPRTE